MQDTGDDSNLPVAFFKGGSKCRFCYFKFFYIGASHLASNSLWFNPDFWTCFGLAFRENSLQRGGFSAASEESHQSSHGLRSPFAVFFLNMVGGA